MKEAEGKIGKKREWKSQVPPRSVAVPARNLTDSFPKAKKQLHKRPKKIPSIKETMSLVIKLQSFPMTKALVLV